MSDEPSAVNTGSRSTPLVSVRVPVPSGRTAETAPAPFWKAISEPSGDHEGFCPWLCPPLEEVIGTRPEPSAFSVARVWVPSA